MKIFDEQNRLMGIVPLASSDVIKKTLLKTTATPKKPSVNLTTDFSGEKLLELTERNFLPSNLGSRPRSLLLNNHSDAPMMRTIFSLDNSGNFNFYADSSYTSVSILFLQFLTVCLQSARSWTCVGQEGLVNATFA